MAAFEEVSEVRIIPYDRQSYIDFRIARLPRLPDKTQEPDDYEPTKYRKPRVPISIWMAYFNLLKSLIGPGVLGLPVVVSHTGVILGPLMTMGLVLVVTHMHITLLWCLNEISRQLKIPHISYRYGFRIALLNGPWIFRRIGRRGPTIIAISMLFSQLSICTVCVVFTTDSLRDIMDWPDSKPAIGVLLVPYLLLLYFMKTIRIVSYVSLIGTLFTLIGLCLVSHHIFLAPQRIFVPYANFDPLSIFFVIGTVLFNVSAVAVILSVDKSIQDPTLLTRRFGILNTQMFLSWMVSTTFGILGYWSFGPMEDNILRFLPLDDESAIIAIGLYSTSVAFALPIQCYPATQITVEVIKNWNLYKPPPNQDTLDRIEAIARPLLVITSFLLCYLVPLQSAIVAIVGNLWTTLLALVFPAMMEICILYPNNYGKYNVVLYKDVIILLFGALCLTAGVVYCGCYMHVRIISLRNIVNHDYS